MYIENEYLKVTINDNGGAISSIYDKRKGLELQYIPDPRSWSGQDVVIFPFIARLKDSKYTVDNKEYSMKNHGLARYYNHIPNKVADNVLYMSFSYTNDTLAKYPYKFILTTKYELIDNELFITYNIKNLDDKAIYFEVGGHPALQVEGYENDKEFVISNTTLEFESDIDTIIYNLNEDGSLITNTSSYTIPKIMNINKDDICKYKTYIWDAKDINKVTLNTLGNKYIFNTAKATILALWTMPGYGNYVCVEPWWGIPDYENPNSELKDKPLMNKLDINQEFESGYSIKFE